IVVQPVRLVLLRALDDEGDQGDQPLPVTAQLVQGDGEGGVGVPFHGRGDARGGDGLGQLAEVDRRLLVHDLLAAVGTAAVGGGALPLLGLGGPVLPGPSLTRIAGADGASGDGGGAEQCDGAEDPSPGGELSSGGGEHGVLLHPGRPGAARPPSACRIDVPTSSHRRRGPGTRCRDPATRRLGALRRGSRALTSRTSKAPVRGTGAFEVVGDTGIEPVTSSVSGKRATAAPIARGGAVWRRRRWVGDSNPCTRLCRPLPRRSGHPTGMLAHHTEQRSRRDVGSAAPPERTTGFEPATL